MRCSARTVEAVNDQRAHILIGTDKAQGILNGAPVVCCFLGCCWWHLGVLVDQAFCFRHIQMTSRQARYLIRCALTMARIMFFLMTMRRTGIGVGKDHRVLH